MVAFEPLSPTTNKQLWSALALAVVLIVFLVPLIPESIQTPATSCAGEHGFGCVGWLRTLPVTTSIGFRLFSFGMVGANVPCESGVNGTTSYASFGSACGQLTAWLW
jgi:hypothetical protein